MGIGYGFAFSGLHDWATVADLVTRANRPVRTGEDLRG